MTSPFTTTNGSSRRQMQAWLRRSTLWGCDSFGAMASPWTDGRDYASFGQRQTGETERHNGILGIRAASTRKPYQNMRRGGRMNGIGSCEELLWELMERPPNQWSEGLSERQAQWRQRWCSAGVSRTSATSWANSLSSSSPRSVRWTNARASSKSHHENVMLSTCHGRPN